MRIVIARSFNFCFLPPGFRDFEAYVYRLGTTDAAQDYLKTQLTYQPQVLIATNDGDFRKLVFEELGLAAYQNVTVGAFPSYLRASDDLLIAHIMCPERNISTAHDEEDSPDLLDAVEWWLMRVIPVDRRPAVSEVNYPGKNGINI